MLRYLLILIVFISSTIAVSYKFIPYIEFYKGDRGEEVKDRVFLASNYEGPPNVDSLNKTKEQIDRERRELITQKLNSPGFDRENVIILEEPAPISPQFGEGSVRVLKYSPGKIQIETNTVQPKLLFLGDKFIDGWKATVDGEDVKIFRANYYYMAIPLSAGSHSVEFIYDSAYFKASALSSVLGFVSLIILSRGQSPRKG